VLVLILGLVSLLARRNSVGPLGAGGPQPSLSRSPRSASTVTGRPLRRLPGCERRKSRAPHRGEASRGVLSSFDCLAAARCESRREAAYFVVARRRKACRSLLRSTAARDPVRSDDDGGGSTARCASSPKVARGCAVWTLAPVRGRRRRQVWRADRQSAVNSALWSSPEDP
jgi:hypothetical protein